MGQLHQPANGSIHFWVWEQSFHTLFELQLPRCSELFVSTDLATADNTTLWALAWNNELCFSSISRNVVGSVGYYRKSVRGVSEFHTPKSSLAGLTIENSSNTF